MSEPRQCSQPPTCRAPPTGTGTPSAQPRPRARRGARPVCRPRPLQSELGQREPRAPFLRVSSVKQRAPQCTETIHACTCTRIHTCTHTDALQNSKKRTKLPAKERVYLRSLHTPRGAAQRASSHAVSIFLAIVPRIKMHILLYHSLFQITATLISPTQEIQFFNLMSLHQEQTPSR